MLVKLGVVLQERIRELTEPQARDQGDGPVPYVIMVGIMAAAAIAVGGLIWAVIAGWADALPESDANPFRSVVMRVVTGRDHCWHASSGSRRPDRGSVAVETVIIAPALLALTFLVFQAGLLFYGRSVALAAATQGANAERAYGATPTAGADKAKAFYERFNGVLGGPQVTVTNDGVTVSVTVTGEVPGALGSWMSFQIRQTASGPVERFVA